jgi:glucose/arabinose dehydrogenase/plastocyanin
MHKGHLAGGGESFIRAIAMLDEREEPLARGFTKRARIGLTVVALTASVLGQTPARSSSLLPQALRGLVVPAGFGVGTFAQTPGLLPTSLTFGPDGRLFVAVVDAQSGLTVGQILAFDDLGGVAGPAEVVAGDFNQLLGITFGPDGTLYAADNADNKGRIQALTDANDDGTFEERRVLLHNIPNGRHQTNGMTFGPDGQLYVANGNATDDGIECGPEPTPLECPTPEVKPWTGAILRVDPSWQNVNLQADVRVDDDQTFAADGKDDESVLVSPGYRNIYDVDFWPGDPSMIYTPMNGSDDPASNEPLFRTDVNDTRVVGQDAQGNPVRGPVIDDAGFPSCLYGPHANNFPMPGIETHPHPENFVPEDNPNSAVTDKFGPCRKNEVLRPLMFFNEAHNGTTGLAFERGDQFPDRYDGDLFVGEWGSLWNLNGAEVSGHKITHIDIDPDTGLVDRKREFMTGAVPMDVTFGPDGSMFVADMQGLIYRVIHVMDPDNGMATVEISAGQFIPQIISIPRSTSVLWVNLDTVAHNVRTQARLLAADPPLCVVPANVGVPCSEIDSPGDIAPRESHSYAFGDTDGVWKYQSTTNLTDAGMQGAVVVLPVDR